MLITKGYRGRRRLVKLFLGKPRLFDLSPYLSGAIIPQAMGKTPLRKYFVNAKIASEPGINEYRMSNKEPEITKFDSSDRFLRCSSFLVRNSAVRPS